MTTGWSEPFSTVDELCCYHDHPDEPNNVHLEVRMPGHLDAQTLRAAVAATLAAEPRARARRMAAGSLSRRLRWEAPAQPDHDALSFGSWADEAGLTGLRSRFLASAPPLAFSPPLRLLLAAGPSEDRLIVNAHHAALDGISCLALVRSIACRYSNLASGQSGRAEPGAHPPVPAAHPIPAASPAPRAADLPARRGRLVPGRAVARIAAERGGGPRAGYGFHLLPPIDVTGLTAARSRFAVTVNDLLVCALIAAIADWNAAHGTRPRPIRITVPAGGRPSGERTELGNLSRLATVSARWPAADRSDIVGLLDQVTSQIRGMKEACLPQVDGLSAALTRAWLPAGVKRAVLRALLTSVGPAVIDTSLLTNLGAVAEPPRFGELAAAGLVFSTSAHMPRGLSVGAITVAGKLQICLRYRRTLLDEPAAARFAACFSRALDELVSRAAAATG